MSQKIIEPQVIMESPRDSYSGLKRIEYNVLSRIARGVMFAPQNPHENGNSIRARLVDRGLAYTYEAFPSREHYTHMMGLTIEGHIKLSMYERAKENRKKCVKCHNWMKLNPSEKTPLQQMPKPYSLHCVNCARIEYPEITEERISLILGEVKDGEAAAEV